MEKGMPQPPPPGFIPPPPPPPYIEHQPQSTIVINQTGFDTVSQRLVCPYCRLEIETNVQSEATMTTHLVALLLCVLGLWCCAPCPYCVQSCMTTKHYCPNCKAYLGEAAK